jgi:hypothetical protein
MRTPSDDIATLTEFYKDNVAYQRHHEDIRFKGSQLTITLAGVLTAALKFSSSNTVNYTIAAFIIMLGALGVAQVIKHTERADRHATIARAYRRKISEISVANGSSSVEQVHDHGADIHKRRAGVAYRLRARWFWLAMHFAILLFGVAIVVLQYRGLI